MACYTDNITELAPVAMPGMPGYWIFRWSDSYSDKLYQLYINGELAAQSRSTEAGKELTGQVSGKFSWQIVAIDPSDAGTDYSSELDLTDDAGGRVLIKWPRRSTELERGGYANIFWDTGSGTIDTDNAINDDEIMNFPPGAAAWGHGLGPHGDEAHGYEGLGIGHGFEAHGIGGHGFGCDYVQFLTQRLPPGVYQFRLTLYDAAGNSVDCTDLTITVDPPPVPPAAIEIKSYVSGSDALTLTVTAGTEVDPYA